jgi:hypothetical protein
MAMVSGGRAQGLPTTSAAPALPFKTGAQSMQTRVGFDTPNLGIALLWAEQSLQAMRPQCRQWCLRRRAGKRDGCEAPRWLCILPWWVVGGSCWRRQGVHGASHRRFEALKTAAQS